MTRPLIDFQRVCLLVSAAVLLLCSACAAPPAPTPAPKREPVEVVPPRDPGRVGDAAWWI